MSETPKDSEPRELHLYFEYIFTSRLALPDFQVSFKSACPGRHLFVYQEQRILP